MPMEIIISPQSIITAGGVTGAVIALVGYMLKVHKWYLKQEAQDVAIKELGATHNSDIKALKEEQTLLTYGILACLKGLKEQGCNGPVTEAIDRIEKHLNKKAHE